MSQPEVEVVKVMESHGREKSTMVGRGLVFSQEKKEDESNNFFLEKIQFFLEYTTKGLFRIIALEQE